MIARPSPLITPDSPRYWTVDVPGRGLHTFRTPYFGIATACLQVLAEAPPVAKQPELPEKPTSEQLAEAGRISLATLTTAVPYAGLLVGACWAHPAFALQAVMPADLMGGPLLAYGHAVAEELQDADYSMLDLASTLFAGVASGLRHRHGVFQMVQDRLAFSEARTEHSTTS